MTCEEFNKKYAEYLEPRHYGCAISNEKALDYLDEKFQKFIQNPAFKYSQIKQKWGYFCFYASGITFDDKDEVEVTLEKIYKDV